MLEDSAAPDGGWAGEVLESSASLLSSGINCDLTMFWSFLIGVREGLGVKQYFHLARSSRWLLLSCVRCLTDDSLTNKSQAEGVLSWPGVVARICDSITWETEADGAPISG